MGKWQNTRKHHKQKSQEVSSLSADDHKAAKRKRQDSMADTNTYNKKDPQNKHRLGMVNKRL